MAKRKNKKCKCNHPDIDFSAEIAADGHKRYFAACRDRLFSGEVHQLACAIEFAQFRFPPEVVVSILEWLLSNPKAQDNLMAQYVDTKKKEREGKETNNDRAEIHA